ncbi:MAG: hypothetical protein JNN08_00150 [Bryobacterales bacterium]|nr:hypothetical protein [Bryobacterales bacterium]
MTSRRQPAGLRDVVTGAVLGAALVLAAGACASVLRPAPDLDGLLDKDLDEDPDSDELLEEAETLWAGEARFPGGVRTLRRGGPAPRQGGKGVVAKARLDLVEVA